MSWVGFKIYNVVQKLIILNWFAKIEARRTFVTKGWELMQFDVSEKLIANRISTKKVSK